MNASPPAPARTRTWLGQALLRAQSDERLAALAGDGSTAAFVVLVDRYRAELAGQARHHAGAQAADDVLQQTLTSAWAALRSGTEVHHPRAWLHQIARNAALQARRPRPGDAGEASLDELPSESAEDRYLRGAGAHDALAAMAKLPERQRRALEMTALHGVSARGAARELGLNENALRQAVHRARRTVRRVASAVTPYPLLHWALPTGGAETVSAMAAGAGAGTAAVVLKGTAVVVAAGVGIGGTAALLGTHRFAREARPAEASALAKPRSSPGAAAVGLGPSVGRQLAASSGAPGGANSPGAQRIGAPTGHRHAGAHGRLNQAHGLDEGNRSSRDGADHDGTHHAGTQSSDSSGDGSKGTHGSEHPNQGGSPSVPQLAGAETHPTPSSDAGQPSTGSPVEHGDTPTTPAPTSPAGALTDH